MNKTPQMSNNCIDLAKTLQKIGIECTINDSVRIKYDKRFNKYIIHNDCVIHVTNTNTNTNTNTVYNVKAMGTFSDLLQNNKSWNP